jgi:xanthine dehydrogenase accessory factor
MRAVAGLPENATEPLSIPENSNPLASSILQDLAKLAKLAVNNRASLETMIPVGKGQTRVWADYRPARPGLWIFSAGDDAKPLLNLAQELGWYVVIADGRSHLATRERFPSADEVHVLPVFDLADNSAAFLRPHPTDAAVVMTHSFDQDSRILASLLALGFPLAYLGVLGPQRRTRELLTEAARLLRLPDTSDRVDQWLAQMRAPTGLDLGGETPAAVALSIVAEIQKAYTASTGQPLSKVRATREIATKT